MGLTNIAGYWRHNALRLMNYVEAMAVTVPPPGAIHGLSRTLHWFVLWGFASVLLTSCAHTVTGPDWSSNEGWSDTYCNDLYFSGYGEALIVESSSVALANAQARARRELSKKVQAQISGELMPLLMDADREAARQVSLTIHKSTVLDLMGTEVRFYLDVDNQMARSVVFVRRSVLAQKYAERRSALLERIMGISIRAQEMRARGDVQGALETLQRSYPLYVELREAEAVCLVASTEMGHYAPSAAFSFVNTITEELLDGSVDSVDDAARRIALSLAHQMGDEREPTMVKAFVYQDTEWGSPFARDFGEAFVKVLEERSGWLLPDSNDTLTPPLVQLNQAVSGQACASWIVYGTYWDLGGTVSVLAVVRDVSSMRILASAEVTIPKMAIVAAGLDLVPQNLLRAIEDQQVFSKGEVVSSNLHVEVWTNKGSENLLFSKGDAIQVYLRVNRPAYIQMIYHLSNGIRTVLLQNYYIDITRVNQVVEVSETYLVEAPFGVEVLQVFAMVEEFPPVPLVHKDGYDVLMEDLAGYVANVRGLGVSKRTKGLSQMAEARIVVTTVDR